MELGTAIKEIRKSKKVKQKDLAEGVGISATALVNIENNDSVPRKETLNKIAAFLGVSIQQLVFTSLEEEDLPESKRAAFKIMSPVIKQFFNEQT